MPTALDLQIRPVATDLIGQFGRTVIVRHVENGYNPQTDETTTVRTDISTKGVIEGYSAKLMQAKYTMAGSERATLIQVGDLQVTVPGEAFDSSPLPADVVFLDSTSGSLYTIVSVEPVYSGEQVAIYILQVRGEPESD